ncbi:hypothetical protein M406DRAFT_251339 [Cryphonectria parasitica EP155]|uniref:Fe2OG dioxygenase domain-containing protein n=1 Tax=Cryphonectria parasitica (strain ATCC 38755 / EP155) TaxID=660469 RepID=A0A9P5CTE3_CRYP1|nr:uncharacterized protein M406DRAFT_251339 [Cryphonectria parasitica EP155]KAF3769070.1 hypothetical protein M406DRAFT_251339 [Cryphonectria parasitica EP155]
MSKKRTLDAFFAPPSKQRKVDEIQKDEIPSTHATYPFPIPDFPAHISKDLSSLPAVEGRVINDQPDLDLLYFEPYVPTYLAKDVFSFLRSQLPFYRVKYTIKRGSTETNINTPRYTTVFGLDETSRFSEEGGGKTAIVDAETGRKVAASAYARYAPRPIPKCLDDLRRSAEAATGGCKFNFCLVNYYSSGADSISYHSDDERFLGPEPAIASFSFGARRDFLMKHKPAVVGGQQQQEVELPEAKPLKLPLGSGDMVLMRGKTQSCWLHAIPKRSGKNDPGGRINITFRRAMVKGGTDNYYNYNLGTGPVYKWNENAREMQIWKS